ITGELVDVLVDDDPGRAFCRGTVQSVLEPSPDRVAPACPAAAAGAGCCDWSHIAPGAARDLAGRILAEQVSRIGRIDLHDGPCHVEVPAGEPVTSGRRAAARWVTGDDGMPGVRTARSRELVAEAGIQPDPRLRGAVSSASFGADRVLLGV